MDATVSAQGRRQSQELATAFRARVPGIDRLFGSDLQRCTVLTDALSAAYGVPGTDGAAAASAFPAVHTAELREQHMGAWEGRTWESLTMQDPDAVNAYWADYVDAVPPGGESWRACQARIVRWWERSAADWPDGGRVVLVTHVGVIRALMCHWLGLGPDQALRFAPAHASHTEVLLADAGVVVEALGERLVG
jgi:broad specificity phosphatase PhoE